jgi:DNA helicase-2/ATP-dependent DNA helicase PcrA
MENLFENLNAEQAQAVRHESGPLLIVAGAGTGKTTVITRRITHLVKENLCKPDEILALTFTEKAAGEMQERVDLLMPMGYTDSWISTFHSFCERILMAHALDIGIPNDFTLLDDVRQWIFVYKNIDKFNLKYYKPLGNPGKFIDSLLTHFSRCKDELITPEQYLEHAQKLRLQTDAPVKTRGKGKGVRGKTAIAELKPVTLNLEHAPEESEVMRLEEVANAYHVYQKLLLDNNYLDFADLINYTLELFKKRPKILAYYQEKFKYILVDEFQDTNFAQYELVKMLAGGHHNICVVGDDDQSIYKFRGASVSNILKFKEDFPSLTEITLVENYRSSQNILDLAYNFIQTNNPDRLEVKLKIDKKLKSNVPGEGVIEVLEADDLSGELNMVVKKIWELKNSPQPSLLKREGELPSWNNFAILIRANSAAEELLPILSENGIPFTFVANKGLYKKPIVVDILAYMRVLEDFHDSTSLYRIICLPKFKLEHFDIATILYHANKKTLSLFEALLEAHAIEGISTATKAMAQKITDMIRHHSDLARRQSAAEITVQIIRDLGIDMKISEDTMENAENRELLDQFYKKIESFGQQSVEKSLHGFLQALDLELEAGSDGTIKFDPNIGPETVKVLTVHSAKGLEFETVFIIGMVDQRFPTRQKGEGIEMPKELIKDILPEGDFHLQEERRLFYVAMTRAKKNLYLTWAKNYGGTKAKKPSLFLQETNLVPSEQVTHATGKVVFTKPEKPLVQVYKKLPAFFSYSQLNDFKSCPLKYKYCNYLKLPVKGSLYFSFGNTIHKVFEEYLKIYKANLESSQQDLFGKTNTGEIPSFSVLTALYQKHWIDDWYESQQQKKEHRALGEKMIRKFYDNLKVNPCHPKYIEQRFKLKIGNYFFVGKIDRADKKDGGVEIWDYKTGGISKEKRDVDQLRVYQWAAEEQLREKVVGMKYWYLKEDANDFIEAEIATQDEIDILKSQILEDIEKIIHTTKYDLFKEEHKHSPRHNCEYEDLE